jgi:hypothetical protein
MQILNNKGATPSTIEIEEIKIKVAKRKPPGDCWIPLDDTSIVFNSLTDVLEYVYQRKGNTQFYMDAREGVIYVVTHNEIII